MERGREVERGLLLGSILGGIGLLVLIGSRERLGGLSGRSPRSKDIVIEGLEPRELPRGSGDEGSIALGL